MDRTIMLVEDNLDDVELTLRAFQKLNFKNKIVIANDGEQAIEMIDKYTRDTIPAVVLLDLKLPQICGHDVLKHIRENDVTHLMPVIILTTSGEESDKHKCYTLGANSYICKPVNFDQFVETIKYLGNYWINLNELPSAV